MPFWSPHSGADVLNPSAPLCRLVHKQSSASPQDPQATNVAQTSWRTEAPGEVLLGEGFGCMSSQHKVTPDITELQNP